MKPIFILALFASAMHAGGAQAASSNQCAGEAVKQAEKLLKFHSNNDDRARVDPDSVKSVGTVKSLVGDRRFDVLEVWGSIYKGEYRMHLIYAPIGKDCVLMGQEIFEHSDPY